MSLAKSKKKFYKQEIVYEDPSVAPSEPPLLKEPPAASPFDKLLEEIEAEGEAILDEVRTEVGLFGSSFGKWKDDGRFVFRDNEVTLIYATIIGTCGLVVFCGMLPDVTED